MLSYLEALDNWPSVRLHLEHWGSNSQSHILLPMVRIADWIHPGTWCPELLEGTDIKLVVVVSCWTITKQIHPSLFRAGSGLR